MIQLKINIIVFIYDFKDVKTRKQIEIYKSTTTEKCNISDSIDVICYKNS